MNKKLEQALKGMFPNEDISPIVKAVSEMVEHAVADRVADLEAEATQKLTEAYEQAEAAIAAVEETAEVGYQQAFTLIEDYARRFEAQAEAYENAQEEGYDEAWEMVKKTEIEKNNVEVEVYKEFNEKLNQMRDLFVEKMNVYLEMAKKEIYEEARREILNDPRTAEHRVAMSRIAETVSAYMSEDDFAGATSARLEEAERNVNELRDQMRALEMRNVRLGTKNQKLEETVNQFNNMLTESAKTEKRERVNKNRTVSGRGQRVLENESVIAEYHNPNTSKTNDQESEGNSLVESNQILDEYLVLSGLKENTNY